MKKIFLVITSLILLGLFTLPELKAQTTTAESKVIKLTESNFNNGINSGLILVDFYADWCRPCIMMKPILEEVASENAKDIVIAKLNTDQNKAISQQYGISGIPCMILFKDGVEVTRIIGYHEKTALLEKLQTHF